MAQDVKFAMLGPVASVTLVLISYSNVKIHVRGLIVKQVPELH